MDDARFANVDFESLLARLVTAAQGMFARQQLKGDASILAGTGKSAEDLVLDAVQELIRGEKIIWRPQNPDEDPYPLLLTVIKRDFLDLLKEGSVHKRMTVVGSLEDEENRGTIEHQTPPDTSFIDEEEDDKTKAKIYALVAGEKELVEYAEGILEFPEMRKPKDIAGLHGITVEELRNRQRRTRTKLAGWYRSVKPKYRGKGN